MTLPFHGVTLPAFSLITVVLPQLVCRQKVKPRKLAAAIVYQHMVLAAVNSFAVNQAAKASAQVKN